MVLFCFVFLFWNATCKKKTTSWSDNMTWMIVLCVYIYIYLLLSIWFYMNTWFLLEAIWRNEMNNLVNYSGPLSDDTQKDKSVGLVVLVEMDGCFFVELRVLVTNILANNWDTFNHKCKRELPPASSKWPFDHPKWRSLNPWKGH